MMRRMLAVGLVLGFSTVISADDTIRFNRDVRNILADNCFKCHGPDANQRQAELRLDNEQDARAKRDSGRAIVPGKPDQSLLIARITAKDADDRMPPADSGKKLTTQQIATLKKWVASGAKWEKHWSLIRPKRPTVPQVKVRTGSKSAIDKFVVSRLKTEGLTLSAKADPRTLVRRLSFDLTGLPPNPATVAAFVANPTQKAYLALVKKYLASSHYGERMAMYWLDLVRFADTNGIHGDNHREHALYRDYVIEAFNSNKRFDKFTTEQLAGDILPQATRLTRIASGYNRLNMTTREGGAQAKEYRAKYAADRVRNASVVWLGSTLGCAQCHDHKFDPFSQRDFYRFAAFFDDLQEVAVGAQRPTRILGEKAQQAIARFDKQIAAANRQLNQITPAIRAAIARWEKKQKVAVRWQSLSFADLKSQAGAKLTLGKNQTVLATGKNGTTDRYLLSGKLTTDRIAALRLEVLPHKSLPQRGPGRAGNGNFVLSGIKITIDGKDVKPTKVAASHNQKDWVDRFVIDKNDQNGWAILPQVGRANQLVIEFKSESKVKDKSIQVELIQNHPGHNLGHFRLSATDTPNAIKADKSKLPANIRTILAIPAKKRNKQQKTQLVNHYKKVGPEFAKIRQQIGKLQADKKRLVNSSPRVLISVAMKKPRMTRVLPRGNWLDDSGEIVKPGVPPVLGGLSTKRARANRLDLARWMIDPKNPLVARVFVNRVWKLLLGKGIVRSLDDFGSQGTWPTHLDLLDWLAVEFIESGWDVKHMVQLIVTSETYQQTSTTSKALLARDPYNRLLARQNRFRLDAEMVRDNALAISGLLVKKIGGRSVKPYQPAGYWAHLNFPRRRYMHDKGESQYRRGLYSYWCRTFTHPSMLAFDAPSREECTVERPRSNTPLAALALLNDPSYVEAARVFAARILTKGKTTPERITAAYQLALARRPSKLELTVLSGMADKHYKQYQQHKKAADKILSVGLKPVAEKVDRAELAAWTSVARVILNLHETITRN